MTNSAIASLSSRLALAFAATLVGLLLLSGRADAAFGIESFDGGVFNKDGTATTQAGAHPQEGSTTIRFNLDPDAFVPIPEADVKNVIVDLPPGLVGNAAVIPRCEERDLNETFECPKSTAVGWVYVGTPGFPGKSALFNMEPARGSAATFAFAYFGEVIHLYASLRSGSDYGVRITTSEISQGLPITDTQVVIWGVPADPSNDDQRGQKCITEVDLSTCGPAGVSPQALISNPTACTEPGEGLVTSLTADSWLDPGTWVDASFTSHEAGDPSDVVGVTGCELLEFKPWLETKLSTDAADSPTGLDVSINVPQNSNPYGFDTSHLKDTTVTLPEGLVVNASSADGLQACTPAQIGLTTPVGQADASFTEAPVNCPTASKLGEVEVTTPAVDHPLPGAVYLASQNQNPFGSLIALYVVIEDPETGIIVKLPGRVDPNTANGRLTATFKDNPQLPFSELAVRFFGGPRAALTTPPTCGTSTFATTMVPWSDPDGPGATPSSSVSVRRGANDSGCVASEAAAPNAPTFTAGTVNPAAGSYSPFVMKLSRADGTQRLGRLDVNLPKGLLGRLAGTTYCSDSALAAAAGKSGGAEIASPSCPVSSWVGSVTVAAGTGPSPMEVGGQAYLAGPYKGAPLSLAIVTPAVAGPFDIGTVVVRTALNVDPQSAQISAVSDPIPTILQGIPLNIRSIALKLDRSDFTLNPTSCDKSQVQGSASSLLGHVAGLGVHFQTANCGRLGFKPKLKMRFYGAPPRRGGFPALKAVLTAPKGQANIGKASVLLPGTELLEQNHIRTICTRDQWASDSCPKAAIYGKAKAWTPLLDKPLEGPVYLRANGGARELPDLVADLRGQIKIELAGYIDTVKRNGVPRMRTRFLGVPDAPVTRFVLQMQGGRKGLLANNTNLCKAKPRAGVQFDGQNGKFHDTNPLVAVSGCGKKKG